MTALANHDARNEWLPDHCPSWCVSGADCNGEHWAEPGSDRWPAIRATAEAEYDGTPDLTVHPTWDQLEGLAPAVALWVEHGKQVKDVMLHLTPKEAVALATRLLVVAEAVKAG